MNPSSISNFKLFFLAASLLSPFASAQVAESTMPTQQTAPLNLDTDKVSKEISQEQPVYLIKKDTLSAGENAFTNTFTQAEKKVKVSGEVEIGVGTSQRVTKVTNPNGSYCVYSPTVARTDGVDEIQNGLQTQVRSCPQ
ncbi:hypothetical protein [Solimicrobium silvestre]|uniref:Peptidase family S41 n=1 Tax=Solimicrobium silvestre TaxID=2099400 RepID=A0A2S9GWE2_9BURK|nr:hypothetical protein [Solimicrobium silvestre]PRC92030.1 Peptidase family S41 [Solimicrobium silvestre]